MNILDTLNSYIWFIIFGSFGSFFIICNWIILIRWYLFKKRSSTIPLIGAIFLAIAFCASPITRFIWICLIDPGLWTGVGGIVLILLNVIKNNKS